MITRSYIDNMIICNKNNYRRHDLKLLTILYNCHLKGLAVHASKSIILGNNVMLLSMNVDSSGIYPYFKDRIFSKLLARNHKTIKDLQSTVRTLLWYQRFISNFSFEIKPILEAMGELTVTYSKNDYLDEICHPIIRRVQESLKRNALLAHPNAIAPKTIYIQAGRYTFTSIIFQYLPNTQRQLLEHFSRIWKAETEKYSLNERYALAVREIFDTFQVLL